MDSKGYLDKLHWAIQQQEGYLDQLVLLQSSYDNKINPATWATHSQVPTAQHFVAVENVLPNAITGLFPETNGLQLVPQEDDVTPEQWQCAEWALWTQLQYVMKLQNACLPSIKDCFKLGIGYGIIEPFTYTPETSVVMASGSKRTRIMGTGNPMTGIRYRDISAGRIIPYPEGNDFDGPKATPMFWFYDPHPSWDIEAMYNGDLPNGINKEELQGTYKEVRKMAVEYTGGSCCEFARIAALVEGKASPAPREIEDDEPLDIPIIKIFEQPGKWTWIVPGKNKDGFVMLQRKSEVQQMQSGLVKWSAWPDGSRWYPMSTPEADRVRCFTNDLWFNFMIDQMDRAKEAVRVINKSALGPGQKRLPDGEDVYVEGSVREATGWLTGPNIDPAFVAFGGEISKLGNDIQGHSDFMQHNVTRGGTQAFQSLLNTMQSRERLGVSILEIGALTKIFGMVLNYMQRFASEDGVTLRRVKFDATDNKRIIEAQTVTQEDLCHSYALDLDLSVRRMLGGMSFDERLRLYEAGKNDPNMRPAMHNRLYPVPEAFARRLWKSEAERDKIQAENREIEMLGALQGGARPQQPAMPPPQGVV